MNKERKYVQGHKLPTLQSQDVKLAPEECFVGTRTTARTNDVILYPNPASTYVDVLYSLSENEEAIMRLLDMFGNTLKVVHIGKNTLRTTIDVKGFANGIYMYEFKKSSGKNYFGKLIVE